MFSSVFVNVDSEAAEGMTKMGERNWVSELDSFVNEKFRGLFAGTESSIPPMPNYSPAFEDWEAKYFLLGLDNGLFSVDQDCYVQSDFLR
jgi:hypothetical protein